MQHPIFNHIINDDFPVIKNIIESEPACVDSLNSGGMSPLHIAASIGRWRVIKLLLLRNADLSQTPFGYTSLHSALESNQETFDALPIEWLDEKPDREQTIILLLNAGVDPNSQDIDGQTPLSFAASGGITGCVKILLEHGANPNARGMQGATPLIFAAQNGHCEIVELLLQAGADISIPDDNGWQPWRVARANKYLDLADKLINGMPRDKFISG